MLLKEEGKDDSAALLNSAGYMGKGMGARDWNQEKT